MADARATLSTNIATLRKAYGWSRREVCRRTGLGPGVIKGVEDHPFVGTYDVRLSSVGRLAEAFELAPAELLYDRDALLVIHGPPEPTDVEGILSNPPAEPTRAYSLAAIVNRHHSERVALDVLHSMES